MESFATFMELETARTGAECIQAGGAFALLDFQLLEGMGKWNYVIGKAKKFVNRGVDKGALHSKKCTTKKENALRGRSEFEKVESPGAKITALPRYPLGANKDLIKLIKYVLENEKFNIER
ncbi:hypothetical protein NECAME_12080 [Necator americanus]|uniref:Uncharacterized protein n=1 Tax=Necator americanus TaxID=51031 RepID=W2T3V5_NECAM|nr:hypothetical protein NECAME_12080 [Necator americanus]ETN75906.1 hypothetical protein NECAME_12080 [Necator americanus]